jgi:Fe-S cluster assembly iron-binding protein IscA
MLNLTDRAQAQFNVAMDEGELGSSRVRVFIDHRCHCGKAHFSLALEEHPAAEDTSFEVGGVPFVADEDTGKELPSVEIDFAESVWTCGAHMMD